MAGGVILEAHVSSRPRPNVLPRTSLYTVLLTLQACIGGLLFGYDTGVVSSAMLFLPENKGMNHLSTFWQELIVSITPGVAGIGALLAGSISDRIGRRMVILAASGIFFVGALTCAGAPERWTLLAGRILLGLAIGFASMIIPVFISEGSPSHVRGMLVTVYQFMIAFGFVVANATGALFALIDPYNVGWRLMFGLAGVPAAFQFIGFLFLSDTPRFLINQGRDDEARKVLAKVYSNNEEWIQYEIDEINEAKKIEQEHRRMHGDGIIFFRVMKTPHVRKALLLGCSMQMFQQLIGINTILYYTGTIIQSAGVQNKITTIWISCAISSVQAFGTLAPMRLIERLGRRPILLVSMVGVIASLCLMGGAFLMVNKDSANLYSSNAYNGIDWPTVTDNKTLEKCAAFSNCDFCVTSSSCGFCHLSSEDKSGQCLPLMKDMDTDNATSASLKILGHFYTFPKIYYVCAYTISYICNIAYLFHVGFCDGRSGNYTLDADYCKTKYTALPIAVMVIYLICYSFGMGPMPWVFNSEIYPLWARGTCVSLATFTNWIFNLAISLTFLSLGEAIHKYGAFFLYAGISTIGLVIFYFFVPETKGLMIEEVEELFKSKSERQKHSFYVNTNSIAEMEATEKDVQTQL